MRRFISTLMILAVAIIAMAQSEQMFTVSGFVRDKLTSAQLMDAKVDLYDMNDSLVGSAEARSWSYDYQRSAMTESAKFNLKFKKQKGEYKLKISAEEHDTLTQVINLKNIGRREQERDLGVFYLTKQKSIALKDVTVTATKVKFYHRGDTLVYNADAFELAEGSMLDELIKQLPGVELKEGGEIFVNGKKVESLLLNGKDFFRGNNQLMLDNLGAYLVKSVEVYKKQTDRAKFLGITDEDSKMLTMDVKMKKEYIGGWVGNVEGGAGTENRYMGRLFAMHFNPTAQYTVVGNINNMNNSERPTDTDSWEPEIRPNGTKQYKEVGFDYSTENSDGTKKANGNATVKIDRNLNISQTNSTNFLQTMSTVGKSHSNSLSRVLGVETHHKLQWQNSWLSTSLSPMLRFSRGKSESSNEDETLEESEGESEGASIRSLNEAFGKNRLLAIGTDFTSTIKVAHTSDAIDINGHYAYASRSDESDALNLITYSDRTISPTARNSQQRNHPDHRSEVRLEGRYLYRFTDKLNLDLSYTYDMTRESKSSAFYLGQLVGEHTGDYTIENLRGVERAFDPTNSNISLEKHSRHSFRPMLRWELSKRLSLSASTTLEAKRNSLDFDQNNKTYRAEYNRNEIDDAGLGGSWTNRTDSSYSNLSCNYSFWRGTPSLRNLVEIEDTRNPLTRYLANPDLKGYERHSINIDYYLMHYGKRNWSLSTYARVYLMQNANVGGYTYDTRTGMRTYKAYNVDGSWSGTVNANGNYQLSKKVTLRGGLEYNLSRNFNMIGENTLEPKKFAMATNIYVPSLGVEADVNKNISLELKSKLRIQNSDSDRPNVEDINYMTQEHTFNANVKLPWNFSLSSTITFYKRSGMEDEKMNTTEWVWNGRISKPLLKGKLVASLVGYDLLHQIKTVSYYVTANSKVESFTNTIPRYVLFSLQYRFDVKPKKKLEQTTRYY